LKIKAIIDQPDGTRELTAVLTPDQHRFLIEYAISDILSKGVMLPHVKDDVVTIVELEDAYSENPSNTGHPA
jgi:hypothetical protein